MAATNEVEENDESIEKVCEPVQYEVEIGSQNNDREQLKEHLRIE